MSSTKSNSTESIAQGSSHGPPPNSVALVVVLMALLGALVWALSPSQPHFTPAPLVPSTPGCLKGPEDFQPTNITEIPEAGLDGLGRAQKNRVLFRLNMEPCSCGCGLSVAACRVENRSCATSKELALRVVSEEKDERDDQR